MNFDKIKAVFKALLGRLSKFEFSKLNFIQALKFFLIIGAWGGNSSYWICIVRSS